MHKNVYAEQLQDLLDSETLETEVFEFGTTHGTAAVADTFRKLMDSEVHISILSKEQRIEQLQELLDTFRAERAKGLTNADMDDINEAASSLLYCIEDLEESMDRIVRFSNEQKDEDDSRNFAGSEKWARGEALVKFLKDNRSKLLKSQVFFFNEKVKKDRNSRSISFAHYICAKIILELEMYNRTGNPEYKAAYWKFRVMFKEQDVESRINGNSRHVPFHDQDVDENDEPEEMSLGSNHLSLREDEMVEAIDMRRKAQKVASQRRMNVNDICRTWIKER